MQGRAKFTTGPATSILLIGLMRPAGWPVKYPFADHRSGGFSSSNWEERPMTTSYRPTGLVRYHATGAYRGYTLFSTTVFQKN